MKGYRTLVANAVALIVAMAAVFGFDIPEADAAALTGGALAVLNIVLRFATDTPVGAKVPPVSSDKSGV